MGKKRTRPGEFFYLFLLFIITGPILLSACGQTHTAFQEANDLFNRGNYQASLEKYERVMVKYPKAGDRVLFEMGIIYSYPLNGQKDYEKSLECFQKLIRDYPESGYRKDSEMMIFNIQNVALKDKTIAARQTQIDYLRQAEAETLQQKDRTIAAQQAQIEKFQEELQNQGSEMMALQRKIEALEKDAFAGRKGPADKILIEKKERRLTLISKGRVLKTYKIALGGNPHGPKERKGDNKTPEGTYFIDSRNRDSRYHLSLHISYPNEKDKQRARELGVSPGGDIMIHGMKSGFSWAGDLHTEVDWTKGCIAVSDEEIEEIEKFVPNGTVVEIRP